MKSYEIEIGKIYRAQLRSPNGNKQYTTLLIVDCEDKHINIGGQDRCIAEWVYYLPLENGTFGTFTELDTNVIDSLSLVRSEQSLRGLSEALKDRAESDNERLSKWIRNKDIALSAVLDSVSIAVK